MKRALNYTPKYSLSLKYLRMIMSKEALDALLAEYVKIKIDNWNKVSKKSTKLYKKYQRGI